MTEPKRKEELSFSYLNALCAYGSIDFERITHDDDSRDVQIKKFIKFIKKIAEEGRI